MRTLLLLWLAPSCLFWSWHLLASNDILFGRVFHDQILLLYGNMLGIAPEDVPALFGKAVLTDGILLWSIVAFRKRRRIAAWVRGRFGGVDRVRPLEDRRADPARLAG